MESAPGFDIGFPVRERRVRLIKLANGDTSVIALCDRYNVFRFVNFESTDMSLTLLPERYKDVKFVNFESADISLIWLF